MYDFVYSLLGLVQKSVSPWHTAAAAVERLERAGVVRLDMRDCWQLPIRIFRDCASSLQQALSRMATGF